MNIQLIKLFTAILLLSVASCKKDSSPEVVDNNIKYNSTLGIEPVPASLGKQYIKNFNRYTKIKTPNGGTIHIVAQNKISDEQIIRCRSVLNHFLKSYKGSIYGDDKSNIANKMAENGAVLTLLNGKDDGSNPVQVAGQPLYENEIQVEGGDWYINQDYKHRDATYEEILHLVHDYGIGVDGPNSNTGATPEFQKLIRKAQQDALNNKIWGNKAPDWIKELTKENSLSQEYLAAVIDSYYGLWGAWNKSEPGGMWGIYRAKTRDQIETYDPLGADLVNNKFFHPYLTYTARIDSGFKGTFTIAFDEKIAYSHHSRYLKDITLLGSNNTNVIVNSLNNTIKGNRGINALLFKGNKSDYTINKTDNNTYIVTDKITNRDGKNTIIGFEKLKFSDTEMSL
ncbi:MAG: hypothetical protein N4A72_01495 [Bacteroidales bacterium]|jgi:hypothetical protein|nr:hypothetical protein [Bacteroidales bacterium]